MIVLTDGFSNINPELTQQEATNAKNAGIRLISVALGNYVNNAEIDHMATEPSSENSFYLLEEGNVEEVAEAILDLLCR